MVQEQQLSSSYRLVSWLHKWRVCVFGLPIPTASSSYVVCISTTIVPRYVSQGIYSNFNCRYYAAVVKEVQFTSSYRFVRWLHKRRVCVFGLPIPTASCSYVVCISTTIVPRYDFTGILREFPLPIMSCDGAGKTICKLVHFCALIAQTEGLRLWLPHSHSFMLICTLH